MADGKLRRQWDQTALIAALIYNAFATRPRSAADFHPYRDELPPPPPEETPRAKNTGELLIATFCNTGG